MRFTEEEKEQLLEFLRGDDYPLVIKFLQMINDSQAKAVLSTRSNDPAALQITKAQFEGGQQLIIALIANKKEQVKEAISI